MSKYNKVDYVEKEISPLVEGETEIWSGKPKKSAFMLNQILTMAPIAIIWLAFDSFAISTFFQGAFEEQINFGLIIFLVGFFALHLMPVWMWLGNFVSSFKDFHKNEY